MDVTNPTAPTRLTDCGSLDPYYSIKADVLANSKKFCTKWLALPSLLSILQDGLALLASLVMSSKCLLRGSNKSQ